MGVRFDADQTAKRGAGAIVQRVFVEKIARGMRTHVVLQSAGVELLRVVSHTNREHIAARAFAGQSAQALEASVSAAEINIQAQGGGIAFDRGGVDLNSERFLAPVLGTDVIQLR